MSSNELDKRYGLMTAIAMVVGVVIGSGVFFKADDVLRLTGGNLAIALLAWALGAFSMIFGALVFAEFAQRIEKSNGIVDYAEAAYGKMFGYLVGWFKGVLYYAPLSAILAWVAALYTMILLGSDNPTNSGATWILAAVYMTVTYLINFYAPALAGKLQVGSTLIKLIPLILVAIVGTISGLLNGVTVTNFVQAMDGIGSTGGTLATAVVATAFAYEGWIAAVTINSEIRDSKKNLPRALVIGTLIVFVVYVTYFLGIASVLPTDEIVAQGDNAVNLATTSLFGGTASTILTVFVIISCLGTLNGLVLATMRIPYSLAIRNQGPAPKWMSRIEQHHHMPINSALAAALLSVIYSVLWYCSINETFGRYIALDEMPIVLIYGLYLFLYVWYMRTFTELGWIKRFVIPTCATLGALIILYGGITNPSLGLYLLVSVGVILLGLLFYRKE
ncbi:APC family permease [Aeromonas veronii]|uniref:APC family permease n=1 Tax=Aeromonas veronii TaxID=654 RepID=UPI00191E6F8A|nr:APC family permease [Aeromonas veronii]MBL0564517.1 APC family permease [Aeromonas veronii]